MKHFRIITFFIIIIFFFAAGFGCTKAPPAQMEFVLGTVCSVNLYEGGNAKLYSRIFSRIREIDRGMSARLEDSEVARINQNAGIAPVKVSAELIETLAQALYYAELSGGAFDPTVGPLVSLWGIGTENERVPDETEIADALALVGWQDLIIDRERETAFLKRPGMALDLGAIAKGYAADEAARLSKEGGAARGIFDLGGNILALGSRSGGGGKKEAATPWRIGVQDPLNDRGSYIGVLLVHEKSVVTSGVYERYFEAEGVRYHHILSTRDGRPVHNGLNSVTVVTERSIDADALSTAVFALGYEKGSALIENLAGAGAVFVFEDRGVKLTHGLSENFTLVSEDYVLR
jgi:thiamine biosynthesis lipoprotein